MANFLVVFDKDATRRSSFVSRARKLIAPVEGLVEGALEAGEVTIIWAAEPRAPVSQVHDAAGVSVIWGDAILASGERVDAEHLRRLWSEPTGLISAFDGIHAAVVYRSSDHIVIGADLLGMYPVYYLAARDVLLAASSPELIRHHPAYRFEIDVEGLVGVLLTMHSLDGHTLLRGVKRLGAGRILVRRGHEDPVEILHYQVPVSTKHFALSFPAQAEILQKALSAAVARHVPAGSPTGILLSGGRDSRLVAGLLNLRGVPVDALILGVPTDFDMQCAIPVAQMLGFTHRATEVPESQYPEFARLQARWEHNTNGFTTIHGWGVYPHLRPLPPRIVTGHVSDSVLGGSHIRWVYPPGAGAPSFTHYFARINTYGFSPEILQRLLRQDVFGDLVAQTIARSREVYESYSDIEEQRAWCYDLYHRQRFHVGGGVWRLSFGAWPLLPIVDRAVLEAAGAMPPETLANRRAQTYLLERLFPRLASLPFAHAPFRVGGGHSAQIQKLLLQLARQQSNVRRVLARIRGRKFHQRYWARVYDVNGPGWRAIRQEAEPARRILYSFFERGTLNSLLPHPNDAIRYRDGIADTSGVKSLIGFMLWCQEHLEGRTVPHIEVGTDAVEPPLQGVASWRS